MTHLRLLRGFACALVLLTACSQRPRLAVMNPEAKELSSQALSAYGMGRYPEALDLWSRAARVADESGDSAYSLVTRINIANCYLVTFSYQKAMQTYLEARELARRAGDIEKEAVTSANIALLYGVLGDFRRTVETGEDVLHKLKPGPNPYRGPIYLHLGNAYHRLGDDSKSEQRFRDAIAEADAMRSPKERAKALDHFGLALVDRDRAAEAEPLLREAMELRRKIAVDDVAMSHRSLGVLYAHQGEPEKAIAHLSVAIEAQKERGRHTPIYELYAERARAYVAAGDEANALADFRAALDYMRRWRLEVLPAGVLPARWEGGLNHLRSSFIRFAAERAIRTRDSDLAVEALTVAEESRLAGLRSTIPNASSEILPAYQSKVQGLQAMEASQLGRTPSKEAAGRLSDLRRELLDLESALAVRGNAWLPPAEPLVLARKQIAEASTETATFSIFLDSPNSYLWEIRRGSVKLHRIGDRAVIEASAKSFREAVESGAESDTSGRKLYTQIFGEISPASHTSPIWTLILDGTLFDTPWAALPVEGSVERFLVERHALRSVPSLFLSADKCPEKGRFVGVADPIYNRADSRLQTPVKPSLEFARLVGSGAEVEACARAWNRERILLRGAEATPGRLTEVLSAPVSALHFATHFVRSAQDDTRTLIALSITTGERNPALLGPEQIATLAARPGLVVLSGCQSGAGQVIAGAGLMGLTRSWLAAGASNVAASLWPTPDDRGALFQSFYRHYAEALDRRQPFAAAASLRAAQVEMLRSGEWRSAPRYWAAYFLVSKG